MNNRPDNQADWLDQILDNFSGHSIHSVQANQARAAITTKIAEERIAEIKPTIETLRATYKSAVTQGLAGIMKWEISDMIDKLEDRTAELEAALKGENYQ